MKYPAYPDYKNDKQAGTGLLPEHWHSYRLKFLVELRNEKVDAELSDLPYMGLEHIESWTCRKLDDEEASAEGIASRYVAGNVLLGKLRPYLAKVYLADHEGLASTEALVMAVGQRLLPRFLKYVLVSSRFVDLVSGASYGSKMPRASWEYIGSVAVAVPTIEEQEQVSDFLDWRTAQIDALIAKKRALLARLTERRLALVTAQTLETQGERDSRGTHQHGQFGIPSHWSWHRLKFTALEPLKYGANEPADLVDPVCPRYIRITDIRDDGTLHDDTFRSLPEDVARPYLLSENDILLARSGATVGKSFRYLDTWGRAAYAGYLIRFRVDTNLLLPHFASFALQTAYYWSMVEANLIQATIQNFSAEKYGSLLIPLPSMAEQTLIVERLEKLCDQIDRAHKRTTEAIERLTEYRSALITAAVTGQIDVRGVKVPALA